MPHIYDGDSDESDLYNYSDESSVDDYFDESDIHEDIHEDIIVNSKKLDTNMSPLFENCVLKYPLKDFIIETYLARLPLVAYFTKLSINRKLKSEHWKQIYKEQKNNFINNKPVYFSGIITICLWDKKLYVIDGQHRTKAMQRLSIKFKNQLDNVRFRVDLIRVEQYEDMIYIIKQINNVVQLDIEALKLRAKNDIREFFSKEYKYGKQSILSNSLNPRRPKINETRLLNEIGKHDKLINMDSTLLINEIKELNQEYEIEYDLGINGDKVSKPMLKKAKNFGCYLGFDVDFNWVKKIHDKVSENFNDYGLVDTQID
jgi:hypothetical protein